MLKIRQLTILSAIALLIGASLSGCGKNTPTADIRKAPMAPVVNPVSMDEETSGLPELYVVRELNTTKETLTVISLQTGNQLRFSYNLGTEFLDKYGEYAVWSKFTPGTLIEIGDVKPDSTLLSVKAYDGGWEYEDLENYSVDSTGRILTIAGEKLKVSTLVSVFSEDESIDLKDLKEDDVIKVTGVDKEVYCVVVTTASGTLKLTHTSKFDGSFIQIGDKIFSEISSGMKMRIPEGQYTVTVANKGYGGSTDIEIHRGETTKLDLSELEGEGPKMCELSFKIGTDGCKIFLDGKEMPNNSTQSVPYGTHSIIVSAEGYDSWSKYLVVNSETAEISIGLTEEKKAEETTAATENGQQSTVDQQTSANQNSVASNNTNNSHAAVRPSSGSHGTTTSTGNTTTNNTGTTNHSYREGDGEGGYASAGNEDLDYYTTLSTLLGNLLSN